jgi:hypothetical protein
MNPLIQFKTTTPLLFIASLFVASSLHAVPLTWHFNGTAASGSTYQRRSIVGRSVEVQIFLDTSLRGRKRGVGLDEVEFRPPGLLLRGQVSISGEGTGPLPVSGFDWVANFIGGEFVLYRQIAAGGNQEQLVFDHAIYSDPYHLTEIEPVAPEQGGSTFLGPNNLVLNANTDTFSATAPETLEELPGGGKSPSAPAAVSGVLSDESAILEVFIRGNNNRVFVNALIPGPQGWFEVPPGGGLTISEPAAVIHNGVLKLFVRAVDNGIWENQFTAGTGWSGWHPVEGEGQTLSGPTAVVHNNTLKLFIRGLNNGIFENRLDGRGWNELDGGGQTISTPAAVVHMGILKLFIRGLDNGIWENQFRVGSGWSGWNFIGGSTLAGPSALVDKGKLKLFVTGLDDTLFENDFENGGFTGWNQISTFLTPSAPAAVEAFGISPILYFRSEDGRIFQGAF